MSEPLPPFDEAFLRRLDALALVVRRRRAGLRQGNRRSSRHGASVEFADYRDYVRGDDLRRVDWNVYARLERPFVKLFEDEEDVTVHLILDASRSMDWGNGPDRAQTNKWLYARRTAAALGYLALAGGDRLLLTLIPGDQGPLGLSYGPARGKGQAISLLRFLAAQQARGPTLLNQGLRSYSFQPRAQRAGLAIVISDLLARDGYQEGLSALLARGHETILIHTLAPEEVDPSLSGDLELEDVESGEVQRVTVDARMHALYQKRLAAWQEDIGQWCAQRQVAYVPVTTDLPFDELILHHLRRRGLVG